MYLLLCMIHIYLSILLLDSPHSVTFGKHLSEVNVTQFQNMFLALRGPEYLSLVISLSNFRARYVSVIDLAQNPTVEETY